MLKYVDGEYFVPPHQSLAATASPQGEALCIMPSP